MRFVSTCEAAGALVSPCSPRTGTRGFARRTTPGLISAAALLLATRAHAQTTATQAHAQTTATQAHAQTTATQAHAQTTATPATGATTATPATGATTATPATGATSATSATGPVPDGSVVVVEQKVILPRDKESLTPTPAEAPTTARVRFTADPIGDGAIIAGAAGFGILSSLIIGTGEIRPPAVKPGQNLLGIDRSTITSTPDKSAAPLSNIGLYTAAGYAVLDPILSGVRENSAQTTLIDGLLYGETIAINLTVTNLAKLAVRRPRPYAYAQASQHANDPTYFDTSTDSGLSFYSGHASTVAAISATATYLAFARSPHTARPWVTLAVGTALTTFVSIERVRAGNHFPTDVIAGAFAGAGIGLVVPYLHREDSVRQRPIWLGFTPAQRDGGVATINGLL